MKIEDPGVIEYKSVNELERSNLISNLSRYHNTAGDVTLEF